MTNRDLLRVLYNYSDFVIFCSMSNSIQQKHNRLDVDQYWLKTSLSVRKVWGSISGHKSKVEPS